MDNIKLSLSKISFVSYGSKYGLYHTMRLEKEARFFWHNTEFTASITLKLDHFQMLLRHKALM